MSISNFDSFDAPDQLQDPDPLSTAIPVRVDGPVLTDELPTETVYLRVVLTAGGAPVKILEHDTRRKRAIMWFPATGAGADCVCIGSTSGQAREFAGALLTSLNATTRFEITDRNEVWARAGDIQQPAATFNGVLPATSDVVLSLIIEKWSL